jgi:hypothetical protein
MTADVVVSPQDAGTIPKHNDALCSNGLEEVVSRIRDAIFSPHAEPPPSKDPLAFFLKDFRGRIVAARECLRAIDGDLGRLEKLGHQEPLYA